MSLLKIKRAEGVIPNVTWLSQETPLRLNKTESVWFGFLAVDLKTEPRSAELLIKFRPSGKKKVVTIKVKSKDYGVRRLTLPKKMVDLDKKTLERVRAESKKMKRLWVSPTLSPYWKGPFLKPVPGKVVGPFGRRSMINDQPRSPHSGVDLKAARGTPVKATNNGKVVLTANHFFTGHTIVIDHGSGILSMYFHLSGIDVHEGALVNKAQIIGQVGSSGRSTGPHLHWGVRVLGMRVDPLGLTALSEQLEE
ncbi:M23 family metallopeptidase [Thermodesulfobacteriota bacterium]